MFSNINVFEPFCIKLIAFFLNIATYFTLNVMLFDEDYINNRYEVEGSTGFIYVIQNELPKCIYASLAAMIVTVLMNYLSNSKKRFDTLMNKETDNKKYEGEINSFFYYNSCANGVLLVLCKCVLCGVSKDTERVDRRVDNHIIILLIIIFIFIFHCNYIGLRCHVAFLYTLSGYFI